MKRLFLMIFTMGILISITNIAFGANSPKKLGGKSDITEFEIALGETVNNFTYTEEGILLYDEKNFSPAITVNKSDIPKFKISILKSKKLAAGIGLDSDGKTRLFLMDISEFSSREISQGGTASRIYWSPSEKYLVVLCSYEGERFITIDLNNGNVLDKGFIAPPGGKNLWRIKNDPRWIDNADQLQFTVNETCNYYDNKCDGNKIFAEHTIIMDAATLKLTKKNKVKKNMSKY